MSCPAELVDTRVLAESLLPRRRVGAKTQSIQERLKDLNWDPRVMAHMG